jgi:hypothetical protein
VTRHRIATRMWNALLDPQWTWQCTCGAHGGPFYTDVSALHAAHRHLDLMEDYDAAG